MSNTQRFEGPNLERLLEEVRASVGPDARIAEANRLRKGGIAGFFASERFEVLVEVDEPAASHRPGRTGASIELGALASSAGLTTPVDPAPATRAAGQAVSAVPMARPVDRAGSVALWAVRAAGQAVSAEPMARPVDRAGSVALWAVRAAGQAVSAVPMARPMDRAAAVPAVRAAGQAVSPVPMARPMDRAGSVALWALPEVLRLAEAVVPAKRQLLSGPMLSVPPAPPANRALARTTRLADESGR